jgi:hypothetical protein
MIMEQDDKGIVKATGIRVKEGVHVDLYLRESPSEKTAHQTYITLSICQDRQRNAPIHLTKPKAAQLSLMLNQLVAEGSNLDYEKLQKKYPNQGSWHIY